MALKGYGTEVLQGVIEDKDNIHTKITCEL